MNVIAQRADCQIIFINTYYYSVTTFTYNLEDNQETQARIKFLHGFNRLVQMSPVPKLPNAKNVVEFPLWHHIWWSKPTRCSEAYWSHWTSFTIERNSVCLHGRNVYFIFIPTFLFTKFLRASSFLDLYNSFICYTNIISNQNMYFMVKKVCNKLLTTHWSYKCTNIRSGWLDRVIGWSIEVSVFCHPGDNSERLRYCSIEYGKGLKSATNIWHYLPKARMHGFGNQGMKVKYHWMNYLLLPSQSWTHWIWSTCQHLSREKWFHQETEAWSIKLELTVCVENYFYCCCNKSAQM